MRNIKSLIFGLAALVVAFGLVFSTSAFKGKKVAPVQYQYMENTADDLFDHTKWNNLSTTPPVSCGDPGDLPCVIEFDSTVYPDIEAFLLANPDLSSLRQNSTEISSKESVEP